MSPAEKRQQCGGCGAELSCPGCDDTRPKAEDVYVGWRLRTPFGRWETVTKAEQTRDYGPVLIWTTETGDQPFRYWRWTQIEARPPEHPDRGTAEIRIVELGWRDGPMYAFPTSSLVGSPLGISEYALVTASFVKGEGWQVGHRPDPLTDESEIINCSSKAKARTELRRLAREYAKKMGVSVRA